MKKVLTLVMCLLALASQAQELTHNAHSDSVATLRHVFKHDRRLSRLDVFASSLVLGSQAINLSTDRVVNSTPRLALSISLSALYTYFLVDHITNWGRFSKRHEEEAVQRFELHQRQPLYVERRLTMAYKKQEQQRK